MNCFIDSSQIMTSGDVMIEYLKHSHPGKTVYLLGTPVLRESFEKAGIHLTEEQPDLVVVGFDTTLTYHKLERACHYIRSGAEFLATHLDINCPTEDGFIPDCGSFCAAITLSTGKKPKYVGKPYPETVEMILEKQVCPKTGSPLSETVCIQMWRPALTWGGRAAGADRGDEERGSQACENKPGRRLSLSEGDGELLRK